MALSNFIPTIWSRNLNISLRRRLRGLELTNRNYEGEIKNAGDTLKIQRPVAINVGDYTIGSDMTLQTPTSSTLSLLIDQQKYFNFGIDDIDKVQANVDLLGPYLDEGNYALAKTVDEFIMQFAVEGHGDNVITKSAISVTTVYDKLVEAAQNMDEKDVPEDGRFCVLTPALVALIRDSAQFTSASELGDRVKQNGFVGQAVGFDIIMSNSVYSASDGTNTVAHCMYGHPMAVTFAMQFTEIESVRSTTQFVDIVRGLLVYGAKAVKPEALGDLRFTTA